MKAMVILHPDKTVNLKTTDSYLAKLIYDEIENKWVRFDRTELSFGL